MRSSGRFGPLDRRGFLLGCGTLAASLSGCRAPNAVRPQPTEPLGPEPVLGLPREESPRSIAEAHHLAIPDYSRVMRSIVGLRPYREGTARIELEPGGPPHRPIVHAYGHGGAGITLAWGTALEVRDILATASPAPCDVAVLGAGVIGLTTALTLARAGYRVSIYAERFTPHTTSDVAGGQWSPSLVATGQSVLERARFDRVMRRSHATYEALLGGGWGVSRRKNYVAPGYRGGLNKIPEDLVVRRTLERLPFPGGERAGRVFETMLIEPPIFLGRLMSELQHMGVRFTERRFASRAELDGLSEEAVVNALGLGAGRLFDDPAVVPIRGQLVLLEPQDLPYLLSFNDYIFPRADAVVLGGTVRRGDTDPRPKQRATAAILARHRRFFGLST